MPVLNNIIDNFNYFNFVSKPYDISPKYII